MRSRAEELEPASHSGADSSDEPTAAGGASRASLPPWAALARERVRARLTGTASGPIEVAGHVIEDVLGRGGMGIVYAARRRDTGQRVALKMLHDGELDRRRLQLEFRAAADLAHPNLVSLHELYAHGRELCFTMELVTGAPLLEYLRDESAAAGTDARHERLRACLSQLCDALGYLHARGFVHGDIKPLNCMVEDGGRLLLLDFGLARLIGDASLQAGRPSIGGTPVYMAPELFEGAQASPKSDLYALGALLHHVLAGEPPFQGLELEALLARKRAGVPNLTDPALPAALRELCARLMSADPQARPGLAEVATVASGAPGPLPHPSAPPPPALSCVPFVGRHAELARLSAAAARARVERCCVAVEGRSGVGKSTLVHEFVSSRVSPATLVLRSRCYERESVPYQAFEGMVEQLAGYLCALAAHERAALVPPDAAVLARLFPVLRDLVGDDDGARELDSAARRRVAARALFALLHAVARSRPLLLWIDDLQWADRDSGRLLRQLLASEDRVPLLLVCSFRSETWARGRALAAAFEDGPRSSSITEHVYLEPLSQPEAAELRLLLGAGSTHIPLGLAVHTLGSVREVVAERLKLLSSPAHALLRALALARGPVPLEVAALASGAESRLPSALTELRSSQLVRTDGTGPRDTAELFHDRLREAICECIDGPEARAAHARIARAFLQKGGDHETLYFHFRSAGDHSRACSHGESAVDRALDALAFERAAALARELLELVRAEGDVRRLQRKLGDALQSAGRGKEAAEAYLSGAEGEPDADRALQLRLLAAKELLYAGALPQAERLFEQLFSALGLYFPRRASDALPHLALARARIAWLSRRVRIEPRDRIPKAAIVRMRAGWAVAQGMYMIDVLRGSKFAADVYVEALRTGDAFNLAGSYAVEAVNVALRGPSRRREVEELLDRAVAAANAVEDEPYIFAWIDLMRATAALSMGDLREGVARCREVERALCRDHVGLWGELSMCRALLVDGLCLLGELEELRVRVPAILERAEARGHVYDSVMMRSASCLLALADDRPGDAERELAIIERDWPGAGYQLAHHRRLFGDALCQIYRGRGSQAFTAVERLWPRFRSSLWSLVTPEAFLAWTVRGIAATLALRETGAARAARVARRAARVLQAMDFPGARATALGLQAALSARAGAYGRAESELAAAEQALSGVDRPPLRAALQLRRAALLTDSARADALRATALETFAARGVVDPEAFARMLVA